MFLVTPARKSIRFYRGKINKKLISENTVEDFFVFHV